MTLSALLPVYNEEKTIEALVGRLLDVQEISEIVAVDDGSDDDSGSILERLAGEFGERLKVISLLENGGKGAAVQRALSLCTGTHVVIQDGDLEYDPADIPSLVERAQEREGIVILGSRFLDRARSTFPKNGHYYGNRLLTALCNLASKGRLNLTDMATCYKLVPREIVTSLDLSEPGFGMDPEIVLKLAQAEVPVVEVPVSYQGRSSAEGKKLRWRDGLVYLRCIWRYRVR